jgi:hypothetical protein
MTAITKSDCQGEDPIMILVERLRQGAMGWGPQWLNEAADAIEALQTATAREHELEEENTRLRGALELIHDGTQPDGAFVKMTMADVEKISRSALSGKPGERA